jgi:voltage-gated potassium channel
MNNVIYVLLRRIHLPLIVLVVVYAISILGFVMIPGQDDKGNVWHMGFFHAFYFVSYMGTTIGFGEIPYPFTDAQRLWATVSMYATVITWLYGIGAALAVVQDPAFQAISRENAFRRAIRRTAEPFYLICGYGDTGRLLVRAFAEAGDRTVVIDKDINRIVALELDDLPVQTPGYAGDAAIPENLVNAGLLHKHCVGVLAVTDSDEVNLRIAITAKLLHPELPAVACADQAHTEDQLQSFGVDQIINSFDTFAGRLALAVHSPGLFLLYDWMTAVPHEPLHEPLFPPRGRWILVSFGRFGKAVYNRLVAEGIPVTVIEANPTDTGCPPGVIAGQGSDPDTLREAGIENAVGIVAGSNDDALNLSIIMAARQLNHKLFTVGRQNLHHNDALFRAARLHLIMQRGNVVANKIFAFTTTPLLPEFLRLAARQGNDWANQLVSRIGGLTGTEVPETWLLEINPAQGAALYAGIARGHRTVVGDLYRSPRNRDERLDCLALLIRRNEQVILLPDDGTALEKHDQLLMCGRFGTQYQVEWIARNHNVYNYLVTGEERPGGLVWKWLTGKRDERPVR